MWPGQNSSILVSLGQASLFCSPASWSTFQNMTMMEKSVEHGGDGGAVTEHLPQSSTGRLEVSSVLARS
jgi:hypothetical protein